MSSPILDMENINMCLGPSNMGRCGNGRGVHFGGVTMHPLTVLHSIGGTRFRLKEELNGLPPRARCTRRHRWWYHLTHAHWWRVGLPWSSIRANKVMLAHFCEILVELFLFNVWFLPLVRRALSIQKAMRS